MPSILSTLRADGIKPKPREIHAAAWKQLVAKEKEAPTVPATEATKTRQHA